MALDTMAQIRAANAASGGNWFDPETMRWFGSRVGDTVYPVGERRLFVSSEQQRSYGSPGVAWGGRRRWTVREALPDGTIEDVGEFGEYVSRQAAIAAIRRMQAEARKASV